MLTKIAPLQLGCRAQFTDRWQGTLTSFEVTDEWRVLNVAVTFGVFKRTTLRLPFERATAWDAEHVAFNCTAAEVLAREVPPVASPARPLSAETPLALQGAQLLGALVEAERRTAVELVIGKRLGRRLRVATNHIGFEGKVLTLTVQPDTLPDYVSDGELEFRVRDALAVDRFLTPDDRRCLTVAIVDGRVTMSGNVRTKIAREQAERAAMRVPGVVSVENRAISDIELEPMIGQALQAAGVAHAVNVYIRSSLGDVTLDGTAPSARAVEDIVRAISRVPGVRSVINRVAIAAPAAA